MKRVLSIAPLVGLLLGFVAVATHGDESGAQGQTNPAQPQAHSAPAARRGPQIEPLLRSLQALGGLLGKAPPPPAIPSSALTPDPEKLRTLQAGVDEAIRRQDPVAEARAYIALARYWFSIVHFEEAIAPMRSALDIAVEIDDPEASAKLHRRLAALLALRGRLEEARGHFERALAIHETRGTPLDQATDLLGSAAMNLNLGCSQDALTDLDSALKLCGTAADPDCEAQVHTMLGIASFGLMKLAESKSQLDKAIDLYDEIGNRQEAAQIRRMRAMILFYGAMIEAVLVQPDKQELRKVMGRLLPGISRESAKALLPALEGTTKAFQPQLAGWGKLMRQLGLPQFEGIAHGFAGMLDSTSESDMPLDTLEQAVVDQLLIDVPRQQAWSLDMLGARLRRLGKHQSAVLAWKMAVNALQDVRRCRSAPDTGTQRRAMIVRGDTYRSLFDLLMELGRYCEAQTVRDMLDESERYRFQNDPTGHDPRRTRIGFTPLESPWRDEVQALAAKVRTPDGRTLAPADGDPNERRKPGLARARARGRLAADIDRIDTLFDGIDEGALAEAAARMQSLPSNKRDLMRRLSEESGTRVGLLQFLVTDFRVRILLTTTEGWTARVVEIPEESKLVGVGKDALNDKIARLRTALHQEVLQEVAAPGLGDPKPIAADLYALLIEPVAGEIEAAGIQTLLIHPDRKLRYLPFAALWDGERWLAERWATVFYTAASERERGDHGRHWSIAALGASQPGGDHSRLPLVKQELEGIARATNGGDDTGDVLADVIYLNDAFTKDALKDVARDGYQVIHIASHFDLQPGSATDSRLVLGDGTTLSLAELRSEELDLSRVELLTLSACDTAMGGDAEGVEIDGLGMIGQRQGAHGVLASLWSVSDASTARLMETFYRRLDERPAITMAEALRQAQLALINKEASGKGMDRLRGIVPEDNLRSYAHPFHWAPFILIGGWQ